MRNRSLAAVMLIVATVFFGVAIRARREFDPWRTNLLAASLLLPVSLLLLRQDLRRLFALRWHSIVVAVGVGLALVAATHGGFYLACWMHPPLRALVEQLYLDIATNDPVLPLKILLIVLIVAVEELVWRGIAFVMLPNELSTARAISIAVLLYALPQVLGGSWLLLGAAIGVGAVFSIQRVATDRLIEVLVTHSIWSVSIFALTPLI